MTLSTFIHNNKKVLLYCLKVAFTGGLFTFAITNIDIMNLLSEIRRLTVKVPLCIAGFTGIILSQLLFAWRTHRLLAVNEMPSGVLNIFFVNFSSNFYNLIFPSAVAGGAVRWHRFGKPRGERWESFSIIAMERITDNLCWMILLTFAFASLGLSSIIHFYFCGTAGAVLTAGAIAVFIVCKLLTQPLSDSTNMPGHSLLLNNGMMEIRNLVHRYLAKRRELLLLAVFSLFTNISFIFFSFLLLTSIAGPLRFDIFVTAKIIVYITSQIPLSIAGIGLNEFVFMNISREIGLSASTGFLFGFIGSLINITFGLLGGIMELFSKGHYIRGS